MTHEITQKTELQKTQILDKHKEPLYPLLPKEPLLVALEPKLMTCYSHLTYHMSTIRSMSQIYLKLQNYII